MRTKGETEAAISEGITRCVQQYIGRGPKTIQTYLIGDLLAIRLQGVLTAGEQQLVKSVAPDKGRDLLKQVRTQLIETARPMLEALVFTLTGSKVATLHHDISTLTGEEVILFTLAEAPRFQDATHWNCHNRSSILRRATDSENENPRTIRAPRRKEWLEDASKNVP